MVQHQNGGIMAKVLLVGYIRELLEERSNVFHAAGHQTIMAASPQAAYKAIEEDIFDAAVLGCNLPEQERNQMARQLTYRNADTKIVMIYLASVKNTAPADALLPTTSSAQEVLRAVNHVLKTKKNLKTDS